MLMCLFYAVVFLALLLSPAGKVLAFWLSLVCGVFLCPGSGVEFECITDVCLLLYLYNDMLTRQILKYTRSDKK